MIMRLIFLAFFSLCLFSANAQNASVQKSTPFSKGSIIGELSLIPLNHSEIALKDNKSKGLAGHQFGTIGIEYFFADKKSLALQGSMTTNSEFLIGGGEQCMGPVCEDLVMYSISVVRKIYWKGFSVGYGLSRLEFEYDRSDWDSNQNIIDSYEIARVGYGAAIMVDYSRAFEELLETVGVHLGIGITYKPSVFSPGLGWRYQHNAFIDLKIKLAEKD
jgi:hypothetical protein